MNTTRSRYCVSQPPWIVCRGLLQLYVDYRWSTQSAHVPHPTAQLETDHWLGSAQLCSATVVCSNGCFHAQAKAAANHMFAWTSTRHWDSSDRTWVGGLHSAMDSSGGPPTKLVLSHEARCWALP